MNFEETMQNVVNKLVDFATTTGVRIVIALILLFVGFRVVNLIKRRLTKSFEKSKKIDSTLWHTLLPAGAIIAKMMIVITLIGYLGIDTTSIAALIASLGVGVGLAVNGALGNIAGGILILVSRPFRNGDYIGALGEEGTVLSIDMIYTKLKTPDARIIYLPNGSLSAATVVNYSVEKLRRMDMTFPLAFAQNVEEASAVILPLLKADARVLTDPAPTVFVADEVRDYVPLSARVWVKNEDYWDVRFELLGKVKSALDEKGIALTAGRLEISVENPNK